MESEDANLDEEDTSPVFEKPSRATRFRRSFIARLERKRTKHVRTLIKKREDRINDKRLKLESRQTRPDI